MRKVKTLPSIKSLFLTMILATISLFLEFSSTFWPHFLFGAQHVLTLIFHSEMFRNIFLVVATLAFFESVAILLTFERVGKYFQAKLLYAVLVAVFAWVISVFIFNILSVPLMENSLSGFGVGLSLAIHWLPSIFSLKGGVAIGFPSHGSIKIALALVPIEISILIRLFRRWSLNRSK